MEMFRDNLACFMIPYRSIPIQYFPCINAYISCLFLREISQNVQLEKKVMNPVTEFRLFGEKRYLSPLLDLNNGDVVNDPLSHPLNLSMV